MEKLFFLQAITPIHLGVGRGVEFVDNPIMREKVTGWPIIPGSSLKGVLRDYFQNMKKINKEDIKKAFGNKENGEYAGSFVISDAKIVFLPIRSFYGTFAYLTSPLVLKRLKRSLEYIKIKEAKKLYIPNELKDKGLVLEGNKITEEDKVYLEDIDIEVKTDKKINSWVEFFENKFNLFDKEWLNIFKERLIIVPDYIFDYFSQMGTEVIARIRINEKTGTTDKGALWYEENLPAETILFGIIHCDKVIGGEKEPRELLNIFFKDDINFQIGGNSTVGKGQVRCVFYKGE